MLELPVIISAVAKASDLKDCMHSGFVKSEYKYPSKEKWACLCPLNFLFPFIIFAMILVSYMKLNFKNPQISMWNAVYLHTSVYM